MKRRRSRAGFSLIEVTISLAILGTLMLVYLSTVQRSTSSRDQIRTHHALRSRSMSALNRMSDELSRSGHVTLASEDYPGLYKELEIESEIPAFKHDLPYPLYAGGEAPDSDIVFVLPVDADDDGWPDLESDGTPSFGNEVFAYVLEPDEDGSNRIRRMSSSGASVTIARGVRYVTFETSESSGYEVPLGCVRITLETMEQDGGKTVDTFEQSITVRLRNGGIL